MNYYYFLCSSNYHEIVIYLTIRN